MKLKIKTGPSPPKKGVLFSIDLAFSIMIMIIFLTVIVFFVTRGSEAGIAEHQLLRVGSDIITLLDQKKAFDSLDEVNIKKEIEETLPANYGMLVRLKGNFITGNGTMEVGDEMPRQRLILVGKRAALTDEGIFLTISYYTWMKEQQ